MDKSAKVFNTADELLMHTFRAHLLTSVTSLLGVSDVDDAIIHESNEEWLHKQAELIVKEILMPITTKDPPVSNLARASADSTRL